MKRIWKIISCVVAAALFLYLVVIDYPTTLKALSPDEETVEKYAQQTVETTSEPEESSQVNEETSSEPTPAPTTAAEAAMAQISKTQTVVFAGSIQDEIYNDLYPILLQNGYTGMLLFQEDQAEVLTDQEGQMTTTQFWELMNAGWGCALGGIFSDYGIEDWKACLEYVLNQIYYTVGYRPTVYYFQAGEYSTEIEAVLQEEGFTAIIYTSEDAEKVSAGGGTLKHIPLMTVSAETDITTLLNDAWTNTNVLIGLPPYSAALTAEQWSSLVTALAGDSRFNVTNQEGIIANEEMPSAERNALIAQVLEGTAG